MCHKNKPNQTTGNIIIVLSATPSYFKEVPQATKYKDKNHCQKKKSSVLLFFMSASFVLIQ